MTSSTEQLRTYTGPAIFSYGFRPFFLAGALWAAIAMGIWFAMLLGAIEPPSHLGYVDWHIHELLYGYVPAVIAGFLLTAVPNWTGRLPIAGKRLAGLFGLWLAGRIANLVSASVEPIGPWLAAFVDAAFLLTLALVIGREIIAGNNMRNLRVLVLVVLLALGNVAFHLEVIVTGAADYGMRVGLSVVLLLIMVIGGRIVPSFTRNWLARQPEGAMPVTFSRFDAVALAVAALALATWCLQPDHLLAGALALVAGLFHLVRLVRWRGGRTLAEPLVTILHVAYLFIPVGFVLLGAATLWPNAISVSAAIHAWTAGAVALMTLAVMTRASLGHTGQPLTATRGVVIIYGCAISGAVARILAGFDIAPTAMLHLSANLWVITFAAFVIVFWPLLTRPRGSRVN